MGFDKLLKNDYVRLALFAVLAYLAYHFFFVLREGVEFRAVSRQKAGKEGIWPFRSHASSSEHSNVEE